MKPLTILICVGAAAITVLGAIMAKTNPNQGEYEQYAVQKLISILRN